MPRCCLALLLGLLLYLVSPVPAQSLAPPTSITPHAWDDTDPEVELVWWVSPEGQIGWIVLLRWPG